MSTPHDPAEFLLNTSSPPTVRVSPVLIALGHGLNDVLPDALRQILVSYIPRLIGTAGDGQDPVRGCRIADWLIQVYTAAWLQLVPELEEDADRLASLPALASAGDMATVATIVQEVAYRVAVASEAAGDTVWSTTGTTDGDVLRAAGKTTGMITGTNMSCGIRNIVGAALGASTVPPGVIWATDVAVRAAAQAAAWAAGNAVTDTTRAGEGVAEAAIRSARARLAPTVAGLQVSAIALFECVINPVGDHPGSMTA